MEATLSPRALHGDGRQFLNALLVDLQVHDLLFYAIDLRDGALYIFIHETADHGVSVTHPAEFTDGAVGLRFMLEDEKDSLGLNFADLKFKEVHAGHLFAARIFPKQVLLQDLKTGVMDLEIRTARKDAEVARLRTRQRR